MVASCTPALKQVTNTPTSTLAPPSILTETPTSMPTQTCTPTNTPSPTSVPPTPTSVVIVHTVEEGDTLSGIAQLYNVPVDQIREFNASSLDPNDLLNIGQELVISLPDGMLTPTPIPSTPAPTNEPVATPTTNASSPASGYLAEFVAIANEVEGLSNPDGNSERQYAFNRLRELYDQLDALQVPPEAKMMHDAHLIYMLATTLFFGYQLQSDFAGAAYYSDESVAAWADYYYYRNIYLETLGYSTPESAGFIPIDY